MSEHRQELILGAVGSLRRLPGRPLPLMQLGPLDGQCRPMRDQADEIEVVAGEFARRHRTDMNHADHALADLQRRAN